MESCTLDSPIGYLNDAESIFDKQYEQLTTSMLEHYELCILQYNVQKSRDVVLTSLFGDPKVLEYDILAI